MPFAIGFENDGCTWQGSGFGYTFVGTPSSTQAQVVFAYGEPTLPATGNDPYVVTLGLGARNQLGTYAYSSSQIQVSGFTPSRLNLADLAGNQGNPSVGGGFFWHDDEGVTNDLFAAERTGASVQGPYGAMKKLGFPQPDEETQPFFWDSRLYYSVNFRQIQSRALSGTDPSLPSAWGNSRIELGLAGTGANQPRGIIAVGETSLAREASGDWLYFIYIQKSAKGLDANVGRVKIR